MAKLPNKLSELIKVAIADLIKCERSSRYVINMDDWHEPNSHCSVCLAGSVMAQSLKADRTECLDPDDFGVVNNGKLMALNELRCGHVDWAAQERDYAQSTIKRLLRYNRDIVVYGYDPKLFKKDMRALASDLEAGGF